MEINPYRLQSGLRMRAIAHELAHAVEIACLPRASATADLETLLSHRAHQPYLKGVESAETPFPETVEKVVFQEYRNERVSMDFSKLVEMHGLTECRNGVPIALR